MSRVLLIAGHSGGHLMPLLAVADGLRAIDSSIELHALCTDRPDDKEALERRSIPFTVVPLIRAGWKFPMQFWRNFQLMKDIISTFKPDAIFNKGAATGIPACIIAKRKNIPVILHESDAVMGRATKWAARWATVLCLGFPAQDRLKTQDSSDKKMPVSHVLRPESCVYTGNPVRSSILGGSHDEGLRLTGFSGSRPILMVLGGSQGAVTLNEFVRDNLPPLLALCDIVHITGPGKQGAPAQRGYFSRPFVHDELAHLYAITDLALSRAGAGTISELAANGIPTILVPLSGLAQDHQTANARAAEQTGGCIFLQQEMMPTKLVALVQDLVQHPAKRTQMSESICTLHQPDAARRIAQIIVKNIVTGPLDA